MRDPSAPAAEVAGGDWAGLPTELWVQPLDVVLPCRIYTTSSRNLHRSCGLTCSFVELMQRRTAVVARRQGEGFFSWVFCPTGKFSVTSRSSRSPTGPSVLERSRMA